MLSKANAAKGMECGLSCVGRCRRKHKRDVHQGDSRCTDGRAFGSFKYPARLNLLGNPQPVGQTPSVKQRSTGTALRQTGLTVKPWRADIEYVLISERRIANRVQALARQIEQDYQGRDLIVVALLTGTVMFLADLVRHLSIPLRLDFIGVSSYGSGTTSGKLVFTKELRLEVKRRDVLVVDDILDTGRTLTRVIQKLRPLKPRRLRTCVLLDKPARRVEKIKAHYVGFEIPDEFVVGYGLDYAERYRNLPFVGVLKPQ